MFEPELLHRSASESHGLYQSSQGKPVPHLEIAEAAEGVRLWPSGRVLSLRLRVVRMTRLAGQDQQDADEAAAGPHLDSSLGHQLWTLDW